MALLQLFVLGCGKSDKEFAKAVEERDSLRNISSINALKLDCYDRMIDIINSTYDSIAYQEGIVFIRRTPESPINRDEVKDNLVRFESVLKRQKERINQLERQLEENRHEEMSAGEENSLRLLAHLREQIETKDKQIAQLRRELEKKNVDLSRLQSRFDTQRSTIETQNATINELNKRTKKQGEALARQDVMLNNGYVMIGTKDDLKRKGIITKKNRLITGISLDRAKFAKVDIRTWTEINFTAKRPRILTNMPTSSYELTTTGNGNFTLKVKSPSEFWRISNYLVIQTN